MSPYRDFQILTASTMFKILKCRAGKILLLKRLCKKVLKNAYFWFQIDLYIKGDWCLCLCHELSSFCLISSVGSVMIYFQFVVYSPRGLSVSHDLSSFFTNILCLSVFHNLSSFYLFILSLFVCHDFLHIS